MNVASTLMHPMGLDIHSTRNLAPSLPRFCLSVSVSLFLPCLAFAHSNPWSMSRVCCSPCRLHNNKSTCNNNNQKKEPFSTLLPLPDLPGSLVSNWSYLRFDTAGRGSSCASHKARCNATVLSPLRSPRFCGSSRFTASTERKRESLLVSFGHRPFVGSNASLFCLLLPPSSVRLDPFHPSFVFTLLCNQLSSEGAFHNGCFVLIPWQPSFSLCANATT